MTMCDAWDSTAHSSTRLSSGSVQSVTASDGSTSVHIAPSRRSSSRNFDTADAASEVGRRKAGAHPVPAGAWLESADADATLLEKSRLLPSYSAVLTVLWAKDS